ncbi:MAG: hypothetical protein WAP52_01150 [Candidatus Sungiibacteriota bacterium]
MPPEQSPQQKQNSAAPAVPKIAIRTMKTDAEEFLKTNKPSMTQMIGHGSQPLNPNARLAKKLPIRAIVILTMVILLAGGGAFLFLRGVSLTASPSKNQTGTTLTRTPPPPAYFATETSRTISVKKQDQQEFTRLMNDAWHEKEREGTVKRIIIKVQDGPNERFATLANFFDLWRIAPPQELLDLADQNLMVFMYSGITGNRLGFAVKARDQDRMFAAILRWEPSLLAQITPLFFDERTDTIVAPFEDRTYRNIDWRYLKLSQAKDLGIGYGVFPVGSVFLFTTSKEAAETVINRLFDAR